jgi:hypothetical protein
LPSKWRKSGWLRHRLEPHWKAFYTCIIALLVDLHGNIRYLLGYWKKENKINSPPRLGFGRGRKLTNYSSHSVKSAPWSGCPNADLSECCGLSPILLIFLNRYSVTPKHVTTTSVNMSWL